MTTTITTPIATATRSLHLVDLENLVGNPYADGSTAEAVLHRYLEAAHWQEGDVVHVAVNPHLALEVGWRLPACCTLRTASGPDAADRRLLAEAEPGFVARRFGRLVIGSGDHGFIARARELRKAGVGVVVVARPTSVARAWRTAGFPVAHLAALPVIPREPVAATALAA